MSSKRGRTLWNFNFPATTAVYVSKRGRYYGAFVRPFDYYCRVDVQVRLRFLRGKHESGQTLFEAIEAATQMLAAVVGSGYHTQGEAYTCFFLLVLV